MCARGLSVHECANMRVHARVQRQWCWGGCRRLLCGATCRFRTSLAPPFAGSRKTPGSSAQSVPLCPLPPLDFPRGPLCASLRGPATTPPRSRAGERGSTGAGAHGERKGRAGRGVLPFAAGAGSSLVCSIVTCGSGRAPPRAALPPRGPELTRLQQRGGGGGAGRLRTGRRGARAGSTGRG